MPATPKSIVYLRPDTIGDLVIFSSALAELQAAWPDARHTLVVRAGYESLAPLFPNSLRWHVTRINPFKQKPSECASELTALLGEIEQLTPDLIVAPTPNRTWLEVAVAAHFTKIRSVVLGHRAVDPLFVTALRIELKVELADVFKETVATDDRERDWENQHRLVDHLLGQKTRRSLPAVAVPASAAAQAEKFLAANSLARGGFAAVFAGGLANVQVKAWRTENFAEIAAWLQRDRTLPILLLGHESEKSILDEVASGVSRLGGTPPVMWLGKEGELPVLAALLRTARLYVGNDTGAMHLAAAVDCPVVGVFGGGHWPRFRPAARQGVAVVQPLPCFGCNWDCYFGTGPCVKTIATGDVRRAVEKILSLKSGESLDAVEETRNLPDEALALIAAATPRFRELQGDRLDRQHKIEELKRETDTKDVEMTDLKAAAEARKTEMEAIKTELEAECAEKDTEIAELKSATNVKDTEIIDLKRAADDRKTEMEAIKTELEADCAEKDTEIAALKEAANVKDAEIVRLKQVCDEREKLIFTLDGHVREFQKIVASQNAQHAEKDKRLLHLQTELNRVTEALVARTAEHTATVAKLAETEAARAKIEALFAKLPGSMSAAEALVAKDVHIRNIENDNSILRAALAEHERSLTNYAAGLSQLEQAKYYGRLLGEKEAAIQTLHRACVERETIIRQLTADTSGTGRLRKLWIAFSAHAREKWWRPLDGWVFRKMVDDYWMQIGVLRHYEPRPLAWDKFPKPRLREAQLPQIAIVTPSYGQAAYVESTMLSVLNQNYPKLLYAVQDGKSTDASPEIIARHAGRLRHWESVKDSGQADAVRRGFSYLEKELAPDDIMAWLNSDDLIAPRALRYVAEYFATHPLVDVVYGHRIIIDGEDREIGRWIMPRHDPKVLEWIDYVPQETLFWRKRAWDLVGGIDPSFQFALDWDLLARFIQARCDIVRLPYFLGCFRVHPHQKTSHAIHTTGADEMKRIRTRFHGEKQNDTETIARFARSTRFRGALTARLHAVGIRW